MTSDSGYFYRIEHESTVWQPGQDFKCGETDNEFTRNWKSQCTRILHGDPPKPTAVDEVLVSIYNSLGKANGANTLPEWKTLQPTLLKVFHSLAEPILANRELTFELVRRDSFSHLPSRMSCLFLIPDREDGVRFWWKKLKTQGPGRSRLFRVKAEGEYHRGNSSILMPLQTHAIDEWTAKAKRYWVGDPDECEQDEVLFVGDVRVEEELDPNDFECAHGP
jgi:hypothetical protein